MLVKGLIPIDMMLLYAWVRGVGFWGIQLFAVFASLLADYFA